MSEAPGPSSAPARDDRFGLVALLAVLAGHLALVRYFWGDQLPLRDLPLNRGDFSTHAAQARRFIEGLDTAGKPWVYDVQLLAGSPNGVLFDADVKGWELWTWALVELGVTEGWAFNLYVLLIHALVPVVVYASARLFRLDRWAASAAAGLGVLLWFFDSFAHWMWFIGTVTYALVAYLALLPLALLWRWFEDRKDTKDGPKRRPAWALACGVMLAIGHLNHPYIFFILAAPMLAMYLRAWLIEGSLSPRDHALTFSIAALTLAANFWWLRTAAQFWHYILDSAFYEQGGVEYLLYDLFGLLHDSETQGMIGPRTGVRLLALLAALAALRRGRRTGDRRRWPWLWLIASMAALTFLGGYTPFSQIQPYRHNLPLGFALVIPAGWWLREAARARPWRSLAPVQRTLAAALALLALLHLARDVLYFFADSMTDRQTLSDHSVVLMNSLGHAYTPRYRLDQENDWEAILAWIREHDDGSGRFLIHDQVFGEYVMARTDAQVLGGFLVRNLAHSDANWFRTSGEPPYDPAALRRYFETYAVRWVILRKQDLPPWWDQHPRLLTRAGFVDGMIIYRVNVKSRLLDGRGRVEASVNRLEIRGSDPGEDLLLHYHWFETLRCTPECSIERVRVEGDRVGFMRVPAPHPADFVIENAYRLD